MEALGGLFIAVVASVVLGIALLLIVYKMIDGDLPVAAGLGAAVVIVVLILVCASPVPHAVPAVVLVVTLTLMCFFPFAADLLEKAELAAHDTTLLERAYAAYAGKPDNVVALLEVARLADAHGFRANAIGITEAALGSVSTEVDLVQNRSVRDMFAREDTVLRRWKREAAASPPSPVPRCPSCGRTNLPSYVVCEGCGQPYLLLAARSLDLRHKILPRLLLTWALLAAFLVGTVGIGVTFTGVARIAMFVLAFCGLAIVLAWLFRPLRLARDHLT